VRGIDAGREEGGGGGGEMGGGGGGSPSLAKTRKDSLNDAALGKKKKRRGERENDDGNEGKTLSFEKKREGGTGAGGSKETRGRRDATMLYSHGTRNNWGGGGPSWGISKDRWKGQGGRRTHPSGKRV